MTDGNDRYTVISADTHAGGSHAMYREYLEEKYLDDFDAWRDKYKNPFSDLGDQRRLRNWDTEMRTRQQDEDGVAGEVIFPNTVPPFFPSFVLFARPPKADEYEHRLAGIRAHNRWLVDFCAEQPERRKGIGQIFINDIDDAIDDVRWIKDHGLTGGVLLPNVPPDVDWVKQLNHPDYDRLWAVCQELDVPINVHGGTGTPAYEPLPSSALMMIAEVPYFSRRPLLFMLLSGAFERFPGLKFVLTEQGCAWLPELVQYLDGHLESIRANGAIGELRFKPEHILPKNASDYVRQNCWFGLSFPLKADLDAAVATVGIDHVMWGSDYPHDEATSPYSNIALRQVFHDWDPADVRKVLTENPAELYGFDVDALAPVAERIGPTVAEIAQPVTELPAEANMALLRNAS
ncbi:MAG TPA: amidohydrolase family protein [Microthrixaceae bacterium]|nr:amidohydrolase family protein [Microthrixaceae bacterium]HNA37589.1 amidohydrolase family protein [Microthrixaceae bacterium]HNH96518.1 amidohydrolase family protein [Microthrixaceae bacterium]HNJ24645.1 amidohydrolase family protein [Microthrixaceae bacterium]HNL50251.1 amidohydrolase family protein [Microthrixaceae bacterium]